MSHSRRAGFSNFELSKQNVRKSRRHALWCASFSQKNGGYRRKIYASGGPAGYVPSTDSLPSIRSDTLIRSPSVVYQRIKPMHEGPTRVSSFLAQNACRNANQNPEWRGYFSQLVKIEKLKFLSISWYKFELRFWFNLNSSVSRGTKSNPYLGLIWICSWIKSPHHSGFRFAFQRASRVSSSKERAVQPVPDTWEDLRSRLKRLGIKNLFD